MCGICGFYTKNEYDPSVVKTMNDSLMYRGPDDSGEIIYRDASGHQIAMGHRRLSVMDLSPKGHQPMVSGDPKVTIVFNGEIYNFKEIRSELVLSGMEFVSECDTEVVLKAYIAYGTECFTRFNGMFAMAIYDESSGDIILARDRMGVKPLYFYEDESSFAWASELKPIMLYPGFNKELRTDVLARYFCYDYICSPDTIFEHTYKVEPGHFIIYHDGKSTDYVYWDLAEKLEEGLKRQYKTFEEAKSATLALIEDSVKRRMVADVPVGTFLSGGIDSTVVTALAQKNTSHPVKTFTIGFETQDENEAMYAREVAGALGTDHTELYIGERELLDLLTDLPVYYDEPFADQSELPTMLVSKLARQDVTVVLSGDGGDELYCGYPAYDWLYMGQRLDFAASAAYGLGGRYWGRKLPNIMYSFILNRDVRYKTQFIEDAKVRCMDDMLVNSYMNPKFEFEADMPARNWQIRRMLVDMRSYLPDEIMCKTDRATMKYSLEARNPLLDYRLVEDSFRIPHEYKYHHRDKKHILKSIAYDLADRSLLDRPKQGFGVPLTQWLRTYLKDDLEMFLNEEKLTKQGLFDPGVMRGLADGLEKSDKTIYSTLLWAFYVFERWYQLYIEDLW